MKGPRPGAGFDPVAARQRRRVGLLALAAKAVLLALLGGAWWVWEQGGSRGPVPVPVPVPVCEPGPGPGPGHDPGAGPCPPPPALSGPAR